MSKHDSIYAVDAMCNPYGLGAVLGTLNPNSRPKFVDMLEKIKSLQKFKNLHLYILMPDFVCRNSR